MIRLRLKTKAENENDTYEDACKQGDPESVPHLEMIDELDCEGSETDDDCNAETDDGICVSAMK